MTFPASGLTVYTFRSWFDLLGIVLACCIAIPKILKSLQNCWHKLLDITIFKNIWNVLQRTLTPQDTWSCPIWDLQMFSCWDHWHSIIHYTSLWHLSLIWLFTDFDVITKYRFPKGICNGCGMPTGDAYSSGHLVLSHFGTCMCSNVETNLSWTCLVSGLLNFEHPSVLLFCPLDHTPNFCRNFAIFRFKNMCQKESLVRSSTVIWLTNKGGSKEQQIKIVKGLRRWQYNPLIIEWTTGMSFVKHQALKEPFSTFLTSLLGKVSLTRVHYPKCAYGPYG